MEEEEIVISRLSNYECAFEFALIFLIDLDETEMTCQ